MNATTAQYVQMLARTTKNRKSEFDSRCPKCGNRFVAESLGMPWVCPDCVPRETLVPIEQAKRETGKGGLHAQIVEWCGKQWPPVKFIQARADKKSTIAVGACDFVLFLPAGRTVLVECKAKNGKLSKEQAIWAKELEMLGHTVYLVRSMADVLAVVKPERTE